MRDLSQREKALILVVLIVISVILLSVFTSCSTTRTITDEEFDTQAQELRYERDVYKQALKDCNN
tara:strand:+ start:562 stop:756 length:195 start_codon:yes stop_codon:yes gene_type:complete